MDKKLFQILKKIYDKKRYKKDENGYPIQIETGDIFDCETKTYNYSTGILSPAELACLQQSGYPLNELIYDTHDNAIRELKTIINHPNLSLPNLLSAYVAGFGSFPRGRQPIMSYLFANSVPNHVFHNEHNGSVCEICSLNENFAIQKGDEIFRCYWGYSWSEIVSVFYIDLDEFSQLPPAIPEEADIQIFLAVIDMIRNAPAGETPGKLEQRIIKSKQVPNCEKYRLRGQLLTLAELGVMPNSCIRPLFDGFTDFMTRCDVSRKVPGNSRSDIILPLSGWRGEDGLCEERLKELFGPFFLK